MYSPQSDRANISIDPYLEINYFLPTNSFENGQNISNTANSIYDIRQIESIIYEISSKLLLVVTVFINITHVHRQRKHY